YLVQRRLMFQQTRPLPQVSVVDGWLGVHRQQADEVDEVEAVPAQRQVLHIVRVVGVGPAGELLADLREVTAGRDRGIQDRRTQQGGLQYRGQVPTEEVGGLLRDEDSVQDL